MTIITQPVRFRYEEAYRKFQELKYPAAVKQGGFLNTKYPDTRTKAGLETFICNWFVWNGHHMEKTNNMGKPVQKFVPKFNLFTGKVDQIPGKVEWHKSGGTTGTGDMKGWINLPNGFQRAVIIESKIKDRQSDAQKDYEQMVTEAGGIYVIMRTPEHCILFYDQLLLTLQPAILK